MAVFVENHAVLTQNPKGRVYTSTKLNESYK